jgi:hypothetical protein
LGEAGANFQPKRGLRSLSGQAQFRAVSTAAVISCEKSATNTAARNSRPSEKPPSRYRTERPHVLYITDRLCIKKSPPRSGKRRGSGGPGDGLEWLRRKRRVVDSYTGGQNIPTAAWRSSPVGTARIRSSHRAGLAAKPVRTGPKTCPKPVVLGAQILPDAGGRAPEIATGVALRPCELSTLTADRF